jgi:threonine dehydratase
VVGGQGTIGLEILDRLPQVDCIMVSVGGGGLISGIAGVVKALQQTDPHRGMPARAFTGHGRIGQGRPDC